MKNVAKHLPAQGIAGPLYSKLNFGSIATVAGVLQASEYALILWRQYHDSSGQYRGLTEESLALSKVLKDCEGLAREGRLNQEQQLELYERSEGCRIVLDDLERLLRHCHRLGRKDSFLRRVNWAAQQGRDIRARLISNVSMLSAFYNSIVTCSVFRLEYDMRSYMERIYAQHEESSAHKEAEPSRRPGWNELVRDLEDMGISPGELEVNRPFIVDTIAKAISESWIRERQRAEEGEVDWNPWFEQESSEGNSESPDALLLPAPIPEIASPVISPASTVKLIPLPASVYTPSQQSQSPTQTGPQTIPTPPASNSGSPKENTSRPSSHFNIKQSIASSRTSSHIAGRLRSNTVDSNATTQRDGTALSDPSASITNPGNLMPTPGTHHRRSRSGSVSRSQSQATQSLSNIHRSSSVPSQRHPPLSNDDAVWGPGTSVHLAHANDPSSTAYKIRLSDNVHAWREDADQLCRYWNSQDWSSAERFLQKSLVCGKPLGGGRLTHHMLGICASFLGKFDNAKGRFWATINRPIHSVRDLDHADIAAARWLGDTCLACGEIENAVFAYAIALGGLRSYRNALYDYAACQIRAEIEVILKVTNVAWEELLSGKLYSEERKSGGGLFDASLITDRGINELLPVFLASCKHQNLHQDCLNGMFDEISDLSHTRASAVRGLDNNTANPYALTFISPDVIGNVTPRDKGYFMSCDPFFSVSRTALFAYDFRQPSYLTIMPPDSKIEHAVYTDATRLDYKTKRKASWIKTVLTSGLPLPGFKFVQLNSSTLLCVYLELWKRITFHRTFAITIMKIPSTNMNGIVVHPVPAEALRKGAIGTTSVPVENHPLTTRIIDDGWLHDNRQQILVNVVPVVRKYLREAETREE
ncbi:MAG: hypothetical protein M1820_007811 [Bogoriella megaspora]|nr:MAG: hypothetical protein M1820_007811 [Bogoriella megaspora]